MGGDEDAATRDDGRTLTGVWQAHATTFARGTAEIRAPDPPPWKLPAGWRPAASRYLKPPAFSRWASERCCGS